MGAFCGGLVIPGFGVLAVIAGFWALICLRILVVVWFKLLFNTLLAGLGLVDAVGLRMLFNKVLLVAVD